MLQCILELTQEDCCSMVKGFEEKIELELVT
jgi:hypothetical protein